MDFWEAFDRVEPIGEAWRQTADIVEAISHMTAILLAQRGVEAKPKTSDDAMPSRYKRETKPVVIEAPTQNFEAIGRKLAGLT